MRIRPSEKTMDSVPHAIAQKLAVGLCIMAITVSAVHGANEHLDRIDLGNSESEAAHNLEAQGSELMDYSEITELNHRIKEITASAHQGGHGPKKAIDGSSDSRWTAQGEDQWLAYELYEPVKLDSVSIQTWENRRFRFQVETRIGTGEWEEVCSEQTEGTGELETFRRPTTP